MINHIKFGAFDSRSYPYITVACGDPIPTPVREVQKFSIPGRDGDLIIDGRKWRNVPLKFSLIFTGRPSVLEDVAAVREKLLTPSVAQEEIGAAIYQTLTDSYQPYTRRARLERFSIRRYSQQQGTALVELTFDCEPIRTMIEPAKIRVSSWTNAGPGTAYPLYTVTPSSSGCTLKGVIRQGQFRLRDFRLIFSGGGMGSKFTIDSRTGETKVLGSGNLSYASFDMSVPAGFTINFDPDPGLGNLVDVMPRRYSI